MSHWSRLIGGIRATVRRFAGAREGVAAVEFALVMPLLLTMYLGSLELSSLINVDERVTTIAGTIGDLVARENGEIDDSPTLNDYFRAATSILAPFSTTGLTQIVSVVYITTSGGTKVLWSQASPGGTARTALQPYPVANPIPTSIINITKGTTAPYVVVSEAYYSYLPVLGLFFKQPFHLYHQSFYLPRYAAMICHNAAPPCTSS